MLCNYSLTDSCASHLQYINLITVCIYFLSWSFYLMTFGKLHRIRLNTAQRKSLQFQGHYIQNSTAHNPGVYMITWANCQRNKIVRQSPAVSSPKSLQGYLRNFTWGKVTNCLAATRCYHPRVIIRVHQFCAFANCQGKLTHCEVVTFCLVNQKASIKGYLRKLSLKIDKLLGSNMLSHHPGVCKGTCTWRNCVKNSEITRGGGGV